MGEKMVAIRRWGDSCFHWVEEVVEEGYIIGGVLISKDDVVEVRETGEGAACVRRVVELRVPEKRAPEKRATEIRVAEGRLPGKEG